MDDELSDTNDARLESFLETGSEIAGGLVGASLGFLTAGPAGAVTGAVAAPVVTRSVRHVARDFATRVLSSREQTKVASAIAFAADRIDRNIRLGYEPRHDDFFTGQPGDRPAAEEIAEGVLFAAQREHEERKVQYLGNFLANLAFVSDVDRPTANLLLRHAEALSYRQYLFLALIVRKSEFGLQPGSLVEEGGFSFARVTALEDIYDLCQRGLLFGEGNTVILDILTLSPGSLTAQGPGTVLYRLLGLKELDEADLRSLATLIKVQNRTRI